MATTDQHKNDEISWVFKVHPCRKMENLGPLNWNNCNLKDTFVDLNWHIWRLHLHFVYTPQSLSKQPKQLVVDNVCCELGFRSADPTVFVATPHSKLRRKMTGIIRSCQPRICIDVHSERTKIRIHSAITTETMYIAHLEIYQNNITVALLQITAVSPQTFCLNK